MKKFLIFFYFLRWLAAHEGTTGTVRDVLNLLNHGIRHNPLSPELLVLRAKYYTFIGTNKQSKKKNFISGQQGGTATY